MKVLIVDEDKFIRTVYKSELNRENIEVETVADGSDVISQAKKIQPDLILLDVILPGENGFVILENLKNDSDLKNIPVIVFSCLSQQSDIDKAMKLGATKYLPKNKYSLSQVVGEIKKILIEEK